MQALLEAVPWLTTSSSHKRRVFEKQHAKSYEYCMEFKMHAKANMSYKVKAWATLHPVDKQWKGGTTENV